MYTSTSITTKYFGPTDRKGSRIKAQLNVDGPSITIPYPSQLSGVDCHYAAVKALCENLGMEGKEWVAAWQRNGYIFVEIEGG